MLSCSTIIITSNQSDLITHTFRVVLGLEDLLGSGLDFFKRETVWLVLDDGVLAGHLSSYHSVPLMISRSRSEMSQLHLILLGHNLCLL